MTDSFVLEFISKLRAKLLDLSGRNSLISFKHSAKSRKQLRFIDVSPDVAFRMLEDGKPIEIAPLPLPNSEPEDEQTPEFIGALERARQEDAIYLSEVDKLGPNPPVKPMLKLEGDLRDRVRISLEMKAIARSKVLAKDVHATALGIDPSYDLLNGEQRRGRRQRHPRQLPTLLYPEEFERQLTAIYQQANLSESETGLNTLFLAFGFLEWYESEDSQKPIYSPLLLYPVQVERKLAGSEYQFSLASRDEDASANISLFERLRRDFSIELPSFGDEDAPMAYLDAIKKLISVAQPNWRIHHQLTVGFFSFAKLVMYRDLDPKNLGEILEDSPVQALIAGGQNETIGFAEDYEVDSPEMAPRVPLVVTSADSSQLSAIVDVLDGKRLVIEGPPGTGKSQTITNIIAAALAKGKSVLFVAEKRAALEVVKKRLDDCGLGLFCLELHSNKTRKTDVLKSLDAWIQSAYEAQGKPAKAIDAVISDHEMIKQTISNYVKVLNNEFGSLGKNLHNILWRYLRLHHETLGLPAKIEKIVFDDAESTTDSRLENRKSALDALEKHYKANLNDYHLLSDHPWFGLAKASLDATEIKDLQELVSGVEKRARDLVAALGNDERLSAWREAPHLSEIDRSINKILENGESLDQNIEESIVPSLRADHARKAIRQAITNYQRLIDLESQVTALSGKPVTPSGDFAAQCKELVAAGFSSVPVSALPDAIAESRQLLSNWEEMSAFVEQIAATLSDASVRTVGAAVTLLGAPASAQELPASLFIYRHEPLISEESRDLLVGLSREIELLKSKRHKLSQLLRLDAEGDVHLIDHSANILRHNSWFRFLAPDFWKARRYFESISIGTSKLGDIEKGRLLAELGEYRRGVQRLEANSDAPKALGEYRCSLDLPIDGILQTNQWAAGVRKAFPRHNESAAMARKFLLESASASVREMAELTGHPRFADFTRLLTAADAETSKKTIAEVIKACRTKLALFESAQELAIHYALRPAVKLGDFSDFGRTMAEIKRCQGETESNTIATQALGELFPITEANKPLILRTLEFVQELKKIGLSADLVEHVTGDLQSKRRLSELFDALRAIAIDARDLRAELRKLSALVAADADEQSGMAATNFEELPLSRTINILLVALAQKDSLEDFVDYLKTESYARREGLSPLLDAFLVEGIPYQSLSSAYEISLCSNLLRLASKRHPDFRKSVGFQFDELRERFRKLDDQLASLYQKKLRHELMQRKIDHGMTVGRASELSELGLIAHEISKQRKHLPIRTLIERAGRAIQGMKPCFMMSPLSVAQFLNSNKLMFDLVVMDEASQLRPEDALGAVWRAKQPVIVGDPKQLPPTDFFNFSDEGAIEEDEVVQQASEHESVLDLALRSFQPARRLRWHYRSRHESLIAFSNNSFYDRDLVIFPSPHHSSELHGIRFIAVDGKYERRGNLPEAMRVVEDAVSFMSKHSALSLGIVAINQSQRDLISELLDEKAKHDPVIQEYRAKWETTLEPLFVKNLENVQGDERDAIFISTVYGKDADGNFHQRFGPINSAMGHRRLNVLFSRAKYQMRVFTSMNPDSIIADNKSSRGVRALKEFLQYAKTGILVKAKPIESGREPDSDFERLVMGRLKDNGYEVVPQVGVGGYFIDLAVKHPSSSERYVLGIECDGATYHSAKSARDRDKIRQEVLENLGWEIHRIWSTDWFQYPDREMKRLLSRLPPLPNR